MFLCLTSYQSAFVIFLSDLKRAREREREKERMSCSMLRIHRVSCMKLFIFTKPQASNLDKAFYSLARHCLMGRKRNERKIFIQFPNKRNNETKTIGDIRVLCRFIIFIFFFFQMFRWLLFEKSIFSFGLNDRWLEWALFFDCFLIQMIVRQIICIHKLGEMSKNLRHAIWMLLLLDFVSENIFIWNIFICCIGHRRTAIWVIR